MGSVYDRLKELRSRASALINSPCNVVELEEESITLAFKHDFLAARVKSTEEGRQHVKDIEDANRVQAAMAIRFMCASIRRDVSSDGARVTSPRRAEQRPYWMRPRKLGFRRGK